jgi:hypothetical protein
VYRSNPLCAASVRCFILASPPMLSSIYLEHQWKMENLIRVSLRHTDKDEASGYTRCENSAASALGSVLRRLPLLALSI